MDVKQLEEMDVEGRIWGLIYLRTQAVSRVKRTLKLIRANSKWGLIIKTHGSSWELGHHGAGNLSISLGPHSLLQAVSTSPCISTPFSATSQILLHLKKRLAPAHPFTGYWPVSVVEWWQGHC